MIILISPAKKMSFDEPAKIDTFSLPQFLDKSRLLVSKLKKLSAQEVSDLMSVSEQIAKLNHDRFKSFKTPFSLKNAKQAAYAFKGDTYVGLDFESFTLPQVNYAQKKLRILSGLYGILSPLDLIQPYRLEMGTRFQVDSDHKNLYSFWQETLTDQLHSLLAKKELVVNLASNEYSKAVKLKTFDEHVITPVFKEKNKGSYKTIGLMSKRARGAMAAYIIKGKINSVDELKKFTGDRYKFSSKDSSANELIFLEK